MNIEEGRARRRSLSVGVTSDTPTAPRHAESDEHISEIERPVQYVRRGDTFEPVGKTVQKLPSGSYLLVKKEASGGMFLGFEPIEITTDDLLRFDHGCFKEVLDDLTWFWKAPEGYASHGFSHKRGYLLYGPPGSGKTCLVNLAIKDVLAIGGVAFVVENISFIDKLVPKFRFVEPDRPVLVVLEDIDEALAGPDRQERNLLSTLDGETQINHIAFIATSNHPELLEQRLWNRPGRFDQVVKIDVPSADLRRDYLQKKLGTDKGPDGMDLVEETKDLSIGHLRELIVGIYIKKENPRKVINRLKKMKTRPQGEGGGRNMGYGMGEGEEQ